MDPVSPSLKYCGQCGASDLGFDGAKRYHCGACGWVYYQNPGAAVAAILDVGEKIVFTRRGLDPGKGLLDLPGGFVDRAETAEDTVRREIHEELYLTLGELRYLGSVPNSYPYKGITYETIDLFFRARLETAPTGFDTRELQAVELLSPGEIGLEEIALPSIRAGLERWVLA